MRYLRYFESKRKKVHDLSGIILLCEDRILLVNPRKFRKFRNRWSIPKGHIEGDTYRSALKELKEETGITLSSKEPKDLIELKYKKGGFEKNLKAYIIRVEKSDIENLLDGWNIKKKNFDRKEIEKSKFFTLDQAYSKMEPKMRKLITRLKKVI